MPSDDFAAVLHALAETNKRLDAYNANQTLLNNEQQRLNGEVELLRKAYDRASELLLEVLGGIAELRRDLGLQATRKATAVATSGR